MLNDDYPVDQEPPEEITKLFDAVDAFADAMRAKLSAGFTAGRNGWDNEMNEPDFDADLTTQICLDKPDFVDVANYAMFLWGFEKQKKEAQSDGGS